MSKLPLSLDAYDWARDEIIQWAQRQKQFAIIDIPHIDEVPAEVFTAALLDLPESKVIYRPDSDERVFVIASNLRPDWMHRRCTAYMTNLAQKNPADPGYQPEDKLTPRAEAKREARLRIELARVKQEVSA